MVQKRGTGPQVNDVLVSLFEQQASRSDKGIISSMNSFFSLFILMANYGIGEAAIGSRIPSWRAIHRMIF